MRNGFLSTIAGLLASASLIQAQPQSTPPIAVALPAAVAAEEPKTGSLGAPQTTICCQPAASSSPRIWVSTDYLLWWTKGGPLNTPLLTTGSLPDLPPGAIGQPSTQVLFGDRPMGYGTFSGVRIGAGVEINDGVAVEGNYFLLQTGVRRFLAAGDANGNPRIDRPFFNNQFGLQDSLGTSEPDPALGPWTGSTAISSHSQLQGWELNLSAKQKLSDRWDFGVLGGFRTLRLNEDLIIQDNLTALAPGVLTFLGQPINAGDTLSDFDRFHTSNNFFGGQIGGRLEWHGEQLTVSMLGKVALGVNQQIVTIDGGSTYNSPGNPPSTAPGGVLALPSNIGRYYRNTFSVVPEVGLNVAWNITPRLKATVGYTFLYWSHVARPGAQIDSNLNPAQIPTSQLFGNGLGANRPAFNFQNSDYWAQGINFGLEFKF